MDTFREGHFQLLPGHSVAQRHQSKTSFRGDGIGRWATYATPSIGGFLARLANRTRDMDQLFLLASQNGRICNIEVLHEFIVVLDHQRRSCLFQSFPGLSGLDAHGRDSGSNGSRHSGR